MSGTALASGQQIVMAFYVTSHILCKHKHRQPIPIVQLTHTYNSWLLIVDSHAYAHYVFNAFDKDKNGSISFEVSWPSAIDWCLPACMLLLHSALDQCYYYMMVIIKIQLYCLLAINSRVLLNDEILLLKLEAVQS